MQEIESLESGILRILPSGPKDGEKVAVGVVVGYLLAPGESPRLRRPARRKQRQPPSIIESGRHPPLRPPRQRIVANGRSKRSRPGRAARPASLVSTQRRLPEAVRPGGSSSATSAPPPPRSLPVKLGPLRQRITCRRRVDFSPLDHPEIPLTSIRRKIAERMIESKQSTAAVTLTTTIDATNLVNLRRQFKRGRSEQTDDWPAVGYTEIIIKLAAIALQSIRCSMHGGTGDRHPGLPGHSYRHRGRYRIGIDGPVIRDVPGLTPAPARLARESQDLIAPRCRRALVAEDCTEAPSPSATWAISAIESFTPLINPPQCAVLGMGAIRQPGRRQKTNRSWCVTACT